MSIEPISLSFFFASKIYHLWKKEITCVTFSFCNISRAFDILQYLQPLHRVRTYQFAMLSKQLLCIYSSNFHLIASCCYNHICIYVIRTITYSGVKCIIYEGLTPSSACIDSSFDQLKYKDVGLINNDVRSARDTVLLQRLQGLYIYMYARVCKIDLIDELLSIFDEAKRTAKWHEFGFRVRCLSYIFEILLIASLSARLNIDGV